MPSAAARNKPRTPQPAVPRSPPKSRAWDSTPLCQCRAAVVRTVLPGNVLWLHCMTLCAPAQCGPHTCHTTAPYSCITLQKLHSRHTDDIAAQNLLAMKCLRKTRTTPLWLHTCRQLLAEAGPLLRLCPGSLALPAVAGVFESPCLLFAHPPSDCISSHPRCVLPTFSISRPLLQLHRRSATWTRASTQWLLCVLPPLW